jgi:3-oxoacyl-[acyl-carrier protein] reductase
MDLGIAGKKALVCAASKGLGKGCAKALAREGVAVTIVARTKETLDAAAAEIRAVTNAPVTVVAADVTTEAGRQAALQACPDPDILINNSGGPPPGDFREWSEADWMKALNNNMVSSIMLIKATVDGMAARKFGRIVNITSQTVRSPIPILGLSNGARAGLVGFCAGLARQVAKHNVTINNLLPGPFETDRMLGSLKYEAQKQNRDWNELHAERRKANPTGRLGDPDEFGALCAFVCSAHTGFIVGQNFLLDGGAFNSTI